MGVRWIKLVIILISIVNICGVRFKLEIKYGLQNMFNKNETRKLIANVYFKANNYLQPTSYLPRANTHLATIILFSVSEL